MSNVRFFWIGEESEIFAAESIHQLAADEGHCGTGIGRFAYMPNVSVVLFDDGDEPLEWGELDGVETRMTVRNCDDDERRLETLTGNLYDIYAWGDGGRYNLPVLLTTQYA